MNIYAVPAAVAFVVNSTLAVYLLYRNPKRTENRLFACMIIAFASWDIGEIILRTTASADMALIGAKLYLVGGFLSGPIYLVFTLYFPKVNKLLNNKLLLGSLIVISTVIVSVTWSTELLITGVKQYYWGYSPVYGSFYPIAGILHTGFSLAGLLVLCITYVRSDMIAVRKRAKYVIIGTMIPVIFGSPTNVILPLMGITVIELASAFTVLMGIFMAYAILRYKLMIIPVAEEEKTTKSEHDLKEGLSYLIEEDKPQRSFEIFVDLVTHGIHGLCITRMPPEDVRQKYNLVKTPIIWLSRTVDKKMCIDPAMTAELSMTIRNFLEESKNGVILLDGIEYLIVHNNFAKVLKVLHDLNEAVAINHAVLIMPFDSRTLNEKEYALLVRDMNMLPIEAGHGSKPAFIKSKSDQKMATV